MSKIKTAVDEECDSTWGGWTKLTGIIGAGACAVGLIAIPVTGGVSSLLCAAAIAGPATTYAANIGCKMVNDESGSGLCIATSTITFNYCKWTEPLAFFEITGNRCNDGLIIIIGMVFLLFLIPSLLGGGKK